jgi:5'-nucleotidase
VKLNVILPALMIAAMVATGCNSNKPTASAGAKNIPPMNAASLDVPATPPAAPAASFTPPQQPVIADAPQPVQPVVADSAIADASDVIAPAPAPRRQVSAAPAARKASATAGGTKYKVKKGDSLWSIAQAKYGNGNKWKTIAAANPKLDPNHVMAGQTIVLP